MYCSVRCRDRDWGHGGHDLLCTGDIPDDEAENHPLMRFKVHAMMTNEIFILVAKVLASVVKEYARQLRAGAGAAGAEGAAGAGEGAGDSGSVASDESAWKAALAPLSHFQCAPWWDCAVPPEDVADAGAFRDTLRGLVRESSALLQEAFVGRQATTFGELSVIESGVITGRLGDLFDDTFYASIVGAFELNQFGIRFETPARDTVRQWWEAAGSPELGAEVVLGGGGGGGGGSGSGDVEGGMQYGLVHAQLEEIRAAMEEDEGGCGSECGDSECDEGEGEDGELAGEGKDAGGEGDEGDEGGEGGEDDQAWHEGALLPWDGILDPLDGSGLFPIGCMMNHCCEPNTKTLYHVEGGNGGDGDGDGEMGGEAGGAGGTGVDGKGGVRGLVAKVVALVDIAEGEEIMHSYIDCGLDLDGRRKALMDYGFICQCTRCAAEEAEGGDE
jgi:hypothetical protein